MPPSSSKPRNGGDPPIRDRAGDPVRTRARDRGDACPGALRLHRADDGGLARLRLPTGSLTPSQVEALADAADLLGDGHLGVTSRGNLDLRGLDEDCGGALAERLSAAGLLPSPAHERVRNTVVSPLAGVDGRGHGHAPAWARELDALLCAEAWATALSGRFLFAVDDGRGDVAGLGGDVTLLAEPEGRALVRIGGHAWRVAAADAPRAALAVAEAFLAVVRAQGSGAWRVADLAAAGAPAPGAAAPETGRGPGSAADAGADRATGPADALRDLGEAADACLRRAGVPAEGTAPEPLPRSGPPEPGVVAGGRAVSVTAPLGRVSSSQFRALLPAGEVRVTPWRGFVVTGLPDRAAAEARLAALEEAGFLTRADSPWLRVSACTGRPGCAKSLADVRADVRPPEPARYGGLPVHWSGCERRCGHPQGAWVDVLATGDGTYDITVRDNGAQR
ncbi:cobalamin biosynthesis protein CobG [Streptomyces sp. CC228A]|uniref:cobalamin biosynthesis protein CobG n=1 Tax=Streptomyces sp. CC228A TaxID=2898186 RepID=UPI0035A92AF9